MAALQTLRTVTGQEELILGCVWQARHWAHGGRPAGPSVWTAERWPATGCVVGTVEMRQLPLPSAKCHFCKWSRLRQGSAGFRCFNFAVMYDHKLAPACTVFTSRRLVESRPVPHTDRDLPPSSERQRRRGNREELPRLPVIVALDDQLDAVLGQTVNILTFF